ncbi:MAG: Gfo/Idh/MocA family oxidoreductase [Verrucomicrobiae bacterium]|nr:Gfo/Idh/MocA family oxidoreductase [Verrucomicrobiae bacterium]
MKKRLRFGVIGAGAIGLHHMDAIKKCERAELVAIAESSPQRRKEAMERFHVSDGYGDYKNLLARKDIDAISIALPNYLHAPVAIEALRAGKHVHLEKPMAFHAREAVRVIATAKKAKRMVMVGQNMRFTRDAQSLKVLVEQGELGEVYHAKAWWIRRAGIPRIGSWFTQKKFAGGGALLDIGVHLLDLGLHLLNHFNPVSVSGVTYAKFGPRGLGEGGWGKSEIDKKAVFDVDDYAMALIKLKGGKSLVLEVSWAAHSVDSSHGVQLYGTEGGGSVFPVKIYRQAKSLPASQAASDSYETVTPAFSSLPYPEERLHHFTDCVLDGTKPMVAPEQSLAVQKILDAIYDSARTGREVRL